jgi:putative transposase
MAAPAAAIPDIAATSSLPLHFKSEIHFSLTAWQACFLDVLLHYRLQGKYLLHEFVVMPDHFHLLITPRESLERAMQLIKGGFSFRTKRELGFMQQIWQHSFYDRRVRDAEEYSAFREYIRQNPLKRGLAARVQDYRYSSAWPGLVLDEAPQGLKPMDSWRL